MKTNVVEEKQAVHGNKRIAIKIEFWTDNIPKLKRKFTPKHCLDFGTIKLIANPLHDIKPLRHLFFKSIPELMVKLEELFISNNIKLHIGKKSGKYYQE